jgi:hypothetical protein
MASYGSRPCARALHLRLEDGHPEQFQVPLASLLFAALAALNVTSAVLTLLG